MFVIWFLSSMVKAHEYRFNMILSILENRTVLHSLLAVIILLSVTHFTKLIKY